MFDARTIFTLAVSFLTDFLTGLGTGLGGGVAVGAGADGLANGLGSAVSTMPPKYVWFVAIIGGLLAGLRGLQKNLSAPVPPALPSVADVAKGRITGGA